MPPLPSLAINPGDFDTMNSVHSQKANLDPPSRHLSNHRGKPGRNVYSSDYCERNCETGIS